MSTIDDVVALAKDLSLFAPPPVATVAGLVIDAAEVVAAVLDAKQTGASNAALVAAIEAALLAQSNATMAKELGA